MTRSRPAGPIVLDIGSTLVLVGVALALTRAYVAHERFFYTADWGNYEVMAHRVLEEWRRSPLAALRSVAGSMGEEYNFAFTLPLVPWLLAFGDSRWVFVSGLAMVYVVPFVLVLGAIATVAIPGPRRTVYWSAVAVAILTPMTWVPTLRGMPDTGAALLLALAAWLYMRDPWLRDRRALVAVGILVAGAMLFRRHFTYAAVAFYAAAAIHGTVDVLRDGGAPAGRRTLGAELVQRGLPLAASCGLTLLTLLTLGWPFLRRVLAHDYGRLYAGYMMSSETVLRWIVASYGVAVCLAAGAGYVGAVRRRGPERDALFLALAGGIPALLWVVHIRQPAVHYTLQFTPAILLGVTLLGWTLWGAVSRRRAVPLLVVMGGYLAGNAGVSLAGLVPGGAGAGLLVAAPAAPLRRPDYQEVIALVRYLRAEARPDDPIYVASASLLMDMGTIRGAERAAFGWKNPRLTVLRVPQVDTRDYLPLEALLRASFVVIVQPFQHTLPAAEHDVVRVVHDLFIERAEFVKDFVELPRQFVLGGGATATVYRRLRPTPEATALRVLLRMRERIPELPGQQPDWITLAPGAEPRVQSDARVGAALRLAPLPINDSGLSFVYVGRLPSEGMLVASATRLQGCPALLVELSRLSSGAVTERAASVRIGSGAAARLRLPFAAREAAALVMRVGPAAGGAMPDGCAARLEAVRLIPTGGRALAAVGSAQGTPHAPDEMAESPPHPR